MRRSIFFILHLFFLAFAFPSHLVALSELEKGIEEFRKENFEEALDIFKKVREDTGPSSLLSFYLGLTYKNMGDLKNAKTYLRESVDLSPPVFDGYVELIDVLYQLDELLEAERYIERAERLKISPPRVAFLKGLVYAKEGKIKEATSAFEEAKKLDPALSQAADLQIAIILAKERKIKKAREVLSAIVTMDPKTDVAVFAKEYEASLRKIVEAYRPFRFSLSASYTYDTNVISKPTESTGIAELDLARKKDSGAITNLKVDWRPLIEGNSFFMAQLNVSSTDYFRIHTYDTFSPSISLTPGYNFRRSALSFPLSYTYTLLDGRRYTGITAIKPTMNIILFGPHMAQASLSYTKRQMFRHPYTHEEDRDGQILGLHMGYTYSFSEGRGIFSAKLEYLKDNSEGRNWDNRGPRLSGILLLPVGKRLSISLSADSLFQNYDHTHTIFGIKRKDRNYSGSAGLIFGIRDGFNLNLAYMYTRAKSNVNIYDYKRGIFQGGLEHVF